jgi:predicted ester cyclase
MIHVTNNHWCETMGGPSLVLMKTTTKTKTIFRNVTALGLATVVTAACAHPATRSNAMANPTDENQRQVRELFETFNHDDLSPLDRLVAPDYLAPQGGRGPAGFRQIIVGLRGAFPDLRYTIDDVVAQGDKVAVRWHWTGTHRGPFRGFAATGAPVSNSGNGIFRCSGGKIVAADIETDRLGFLEEIGAVPKGVGLGPRPAPPPAR